MQISIIVFRAQATNTLYANVANDLLTSDMASATLTIGSNSKRRHCHLMYFGCALTTFYNAPSVMNVIPQCH